MSELIVITFDREEDATAGLEALRQVQSGGALEIADAAVIQRDPDGKSHVKGTLDEGVVPGAIVGGALGLLLMVFFPLFGLITGAIGGALVGRALGEHIDNDFVKDVTAKLENGQSALFVLVKRGSADALDAALRPMTGGHVLQTTLDPDVEKELQRALD
ncbi:MAG TPA: DUF1269 domain-containing protein [Candidatus Saccharimonadales bacterium]|nr:DUF1269 domain-containing protein [Candidatus Saccharimonadales bacterium]